MTETLHRTALFDTHVSLNGKMVDFAGWEMPIQFEGILAEARAVRSGSGCSMCRTWAVSCCRAPMRFTS